MEGTLRGAQGSGLGDCSGCPVTFCQPAPQGTAGAIIARADVVHGMEIMRGPLHMFLGALAPADQQMIAGLELGIRLG